MNMREIKILLALVCFLHVASCVFLLGDGLLTVKGEVIDIKGVPVNDCRLELHLAKDDMLLYRECISSKFRTSFVIDPNPNEYFMVIRCQDVIHKTSTYVIHGGSHRDPPLDLGTIILPVDQEGNGTGSISR